MCGRLTQRSPELPGLVSVLGDDRDNRVKNVEGRPRWNGSPGQDIWVIRRNPVNGADQHDRMRWGFYESWMRDSPGLRPQNNARAEGITTKRMYAASYKKRRCLVPIDNFFEWRDAKGKGKKQPYAIAMANREPFALAGIWTAYLEEGLWVRSFAVITCASNELVGRIHDRMPVIIDAKDYDRWLGLEPDPHELLRPFDAERMAMWPISTDVNAVRNDYADILKPVDEPDDA